MDPRQSEFDGKTVIVTGAAQGLGLDIATGFAKAGANVVLTDVADGVKAAAEALGAPDRILAEIVDVRDEAAIRALYEKATARFGGVDVMVNNAALTLSRSVWDITGAEWDDVIAVNLRGVFFGTRIAGEAMRARGAGRIINLSSLAGQRGGTVAGAHYSASKAGILVLTKVFAQELAGQGVTVNAISPAAIRTPAVDTLPAEKVSALVKTIPVGRFGRGEEVAAAALYLASERAGFVTGTSLDVNGGVFMR